MRQRASPSVFLDVAGGRGRVLRSARVSRPKQTKDGSAPDDCELLRAWCAGDQRAGARLFERHASSVAFFFRNKLTIGVEDLVQQTFLGLVEGRERIQQDASVRAYLLGIANNLLLKHLRTLARTPGFDPEVSSVAELDPGPSTLLGRKHEQRLLLEGLRKIPVEHQVALELYYWEGMNAAEIAAVIGISHSAMRSRLVKGRELLRKAISALPAAAAHRESTLGDLDGWAAGIRGDRTGSSDT
jgi:RNA polymerase sigma factor (sigma-70 family)